MKKSSQKWYVFATVVLSFVFAPQVQVEVYSHGGGPQVGVEVEAELVSNPDVPAFAGARGKVIVNLAEGFVRLRSLSGFSSQVVPYDVISDTDPRLEDGDGNISNTSCDLQGDLATQSHWICPVNSYVMWLGELEDGALHHPIPLATIYPREDGTADDRNLSFRGNVSGFGNNAIIITAEETFGAMPSLLDGVFRYFPAGPVVATFSLTEHHSEEGRP